MLKVYVDMISQPSRAVEAFCLLNNIPHEVVKVELAKGQHRTPEFLAVNHAGQVPAIEDGAVKVAEAHAILAYLATTRKVADHWYPADTKKRAIVNQYLHWHHTHLRYASRLIFTLVLGPMLGMPIEDWRVDEAKVVLKRALDLMEDWLSKTRFLTGPAPSIADITAVCEIAQLQMIEFGLDSWPRVKAWFDQVYAWPEMVEVHKVLHKILAKRAKAKL